jgi:hypothetical protein
MHQWHSFCRVDVDAAIMTALNEVREIVEFFHTKQIGIY